MTFVWWLIAWSVALLLWPAPVLANVGLPMLAIYLPAAWVTLIPIIVIESAYGIWRWKVPVGKAFAIQAAANCLSTLVGLPITWVILALGEFLLFEQLARISQDLPLVVTTIVGPAWLGPGAENSAWMVPVASAVLAIPFYAMSVISEYLIVIRLAPDLARRTVWSWMVGANAVSYAFLFLVVMAGWMWPTSFERMSAAMFPVTMWIVGIVFRLAAFFQGR